jgi:tetratricopeptide (TPR) repeat protein
MRTLTLIFVVGALFAAPVRAQESAPDGNLAKGDYFFKAGYYLKASEHYRLALLEDPGNPTKKLAFGHALFAIGNYSYASYALRRGVAQLDSQEDYRPAVSDLFPSQRAFTQALRDLKRYVTYSPRDPAGLTVLGYVLFSVPGEERRCAELLNYLKRLDPRDPFADFVLEQLRRRGPLPPARAEGVVEDEPVESVIDTPSTPAPRKASPAPTPDAPFPPAAPTPAPAPAPAPTPAPLDGKLPEGERVMPRAEGEWPSVVPAPSE